MKGHPNSKHKTPAKSGATRRSVKSKSPTEKKERLEPTEKADRLIDKLPYVRALIEILVIFHILITGGGDGNGPSI